MKKKIRFLINTLRDGGAERVLVNLLNNLPSDKYDIELRLLTRKGPFLSLLSPNIKLTWVAEVNSLWGRIVAWLLPRLSSRMLHHLLIHGKYDVEVAFLEGYATKIIAGAPDTVRKIAWLHTNLITNDWIAPCYRSHDDCLENYRHFERIICVSNDVKEAFVQKFEDLPSLDVKYNPIDGVAIRKKAEESSGFPLKECFRMITIGRLVEAKAYGRLVEVMGHLAAEGFNFELLIIGEGPERKILEDKIEQFKLNDKVKLLGFKSNPYPFLSESDLFVCSSITEGYSTAVAEATIIGLPVLTTACTGMKELLEDGRYGIIVENSDSGLEKGLRDVLQHPEILKEYRKRLKDRYQFFSVERRIQEIESIFDRRNI